MDPRPESERRQDEELYELLARYDNLAVDTTRRRDDLGDALTATFDPLLEPSTSVPPHRPPQDRWEHQYTLITAAQIAWNTALHFDLGGYEALLRQAHGLEVPSFSSTRLTALARARDLLSEQHPGLMRALTQARPRDFSMLSRARVMSLLAPMRATFGEYFIVRVEPHQTLTARPFEMRAVLQAVLDHRLEQRLPLTEMAALMQHVTGSTDPDHGVAMARVTNALSIQYPDLLREIRQTGRPSFNHLTSVIARAEAARVFVATFERTYGDRLYIIPIREPPSRDLSPSSAGRLTSPMPPIRPAVHVVDQRQPPNTVTGTWQTRDVLSVLTQRRLGRNVTDMDDAVLLVQQAAGETRPVSWRDMSERTRRRARASILRTRPDLQYYDNSDLPPYGTDAAHEWVYAEIGRLGETMVLYLPPLIEEPQEEPPPDPNDDAADHYVIGTWYS